MSAPKKNPLERFQVTPEMQNKTIDELRVRIGFLEKENKELKLTVAKLQKENAELKKLHG